MPPAWLHLPFPCKWTAAPISYPQKEGSFSCFLNYWFISAEERTYTLVSHWKCSSQHIKSKFIYACSRCYSEITNKCLKCYKVIIRKFYIVFCINIIKIFCSCACLFFTLGLFLIPQQTHQWNLVRLKEKLELCPSVTPLQWYKNSCVFIREKIQMRVVFLFFFDHFLNLI